MCTSNLSKCVQIISLNKSISFYSTSIVSCKQSSDKISLCNCNHFLLLQWDLIRSAGAVTGTISYFPLQGSLESGCFETCIRENKILRDKFFFKDGLRNVVGMYKQDSTGAVRQIALHKIGTTHRNVTPLSVGVKPAGQTAVPIVNYTFGVVTIPLIMPTWGLLRCVWLVQHLPLPGKTFHLEYWNIYAT